MPWGRGGGTAQSARRLALGAQGLALHPSRWVTWRAWTSNGTAGWEGSTAEANQLGASPLGSAGEEMCHLPGDEPHRVLGDEAGTFITSFPSCASIWVLPHHPPLGPAHLSPTFPQGPPPPATTLWSVLPAVATRGRLRALESGPAPCLPTILQDSHSFQVRAQVLPEVHKVLHDLLLSSPCSHLHPLSPSLTLLQPHRPPRCSFSMRGTVLLGGLGPGCVLCLGRTSFLHSPFGCFLLTIHASAELSPQRHPP